jgi:hypothetical protein
MRKWRETARGRCGAVWRFDDRRRSRDRRSVAAPLPVLRCFVGLVAGSLAFGSVFLGARSARRRFIGTLSGAPAHLADLVMALSVVVVAAQLLGSFGLLRVVPLTAVLVAAGLAGMRIRAGDTPAVRAPEGRRSRGLGVPTVVAAGGCGLLAALWVPRLVHVYRAGGPTTIDSLWYHLPIAARFAQTGSVLHPVFVTGQALETYYPHTSELFHAIGIVFLGQDTLTPLLNLAWLGIALLAAWCIGRPFGLAPLALVGALVVVAAPQLVTYEAGQALNDIFGIAFTLAAVALLLNTWRGPEGQAGIVWSALAMGLAVGSKYTLLGVGLGLTIGVVAAAKRADRARTAALWTAALSVTGVYWYVRNAIAIGNPLPEFHLSVGSFALRSIRVQGVTTVWKVLHRQGNWGRYFVPGFRYALGPVWWACLALGILGMFVGGARRDARLRLIAFASAVGAIVFVFSPQVLGLFGDASFFGSNVRYIAVPLALGLVGLAVGFGSMGERAADATAVLLAIALVASQFDQLLWPFDGKRPAEFGLPLISRPELVLGIVVGVFVAVAAVFAATTNVAETIGNVRQSTVLGVAVLGSLALMGGFVALDSFYVGRRYADSAFLTNVYRWAGHVQNQRIGYFGTTLQYPLTGKGASNNVQYIEHRTSEIAATTITSCQAWRLEINRERLDFVVVTTPGFPVVSSGRSRQITWTQSDPNARLVTTDRNGSARAMVFQLTGPMSPLACGVAPGATP